MKIAIACPGVGVVQRGFERLFADLYDLMRDQADVTLFKGGGPETETEKAPAFLRRGGAVLKVAPVHRLVGRTPLHSEALTFALGLLPHLQAGDYDVVHVIDPPLAKVLFHLRQALNLRFRLLYTEGCAMPASDYPPADHIHQIAKVTFDQAVDHGYAPGAMTLTPCGINPTRFQASAERRTLRRQAGVSDETFVILSVAALNRGHKRTHHLIDEVAAMDGDILLWMDGSLDMGDPDLVDYARARLGNRCRITHVPSGQVGDLYRLADVMAHAAVFEAFGLALVEAAACGLPVVAHDAAHFRWLLKDAASYIDMEQPGALAGRLSRLMTDRAQLAALPRPSEMLDLYDWRALTPAYLDLYRTAARAEHRSVAPPRRAAHVAA